MELKSDLYKWEPKQEKSEEAIFEGHILLKKPLMHERYELIEKTGFVVTDKGEVEASVKQLPAMIKLVSLVKSHFVEVALKKKDGAVEYKSYDDLSFDPDCELLLITLASLIMGGFRPGKN